MQFSCSIIALAMAATLVAAQNPAPFNACISQATTCDEQPGANHASCTGLLDECCETARNACDYGPNANHAGCTGLYDQCTAQKTIE